MGGTRARARHNSVCVVAGGHVCPCNMNGPPGIATAVIKLGGVDVQACALLAQGVADLGHRERFTVIKLIHQCILHV